MVKLLFIEGSTTRLTNNPRIVRDHLFLRSDRAATGGHASDVAGGASRQSLNPDVPPKDVWPEN
jgi:hypothetical protein